MQDRDWWREAHKGEDSRQVMRTARRGAWGAALFWLLLAAVLYGVFQHIETNRQARLAPYTRTSGELVIPRGLDGHFRVPGTVNGHPVVFLVDTGASLVTVSDTLASQAGLLGGEAVTFHTANGSLPGRVLRDVPVSAGSMSLGDVRVGVGLVASDSTLALLGQSFLSRFHIELTSKEMVLRARGP